MKNWILLLALGTFSATTSKAQRIQVGPEIGVNLNKFNASGEGRSNYDLKAGLKAGAIVDIGIARNVSFQPGVFYSSKGAAYSYEKTFKAGGITYTEDGKTKMKTDYLEIPMNLQIAFGHWRQPRFFVGAGPYVAFAIGGNTSSTVTRSYRAGGETFYDTQKSSRDIEIGDDPNKDDIKKSDIGLNLNAGIIFPRGLFLRANAGIGLSDIDPSPRYDAKNIGVAFTAGFLFGR